MKERREQDYVARWEKRRRWFKTRCGLEGSHQKLQMHTRFTPNLIIFNAVGSVAVGSATSGRVCHWQLRLIRGTSQHLCVTYSALRYAASQEPSDNRVFRELRKERCSNCNIYMTAYSTSMYSKLQQTRGQATRETPSSLHLSHHISCSKPQPVTYKKHGGGE